MVFYFLANFHVNVSWKDIRVTLLILGQSVKRVKAETVCYDLVSVQCEVQKPCVNDSIERRFRNCTDQ